jgi:hypothetical protein
MSKHDEADNPDATPDPTHPPQGHSPFKDPLNRRHHGHDEATCTNKYPSNKVEHFQFITSFKNK